MTSSRAILFILLFFGFAGSAIWWKSRMPQVCDNLSCIRMEGISSFQEKDIYSNTPQIYRALFTDGEQMIRIEARKTTEESSISEIDAAVTKIKAMFEKAPAPYPGEISDAIVCDPAFVPAYEEIHTSETPLHLFVGFLNNRLTFGSCSETQAVYRGSLAFTYCPASQVLLRVELIAPTQYFTANEKNLMKKIRGLRCK